MDHFDRFVAAVKSMVLVKQIKGNEYSRLGLSNCRWANNKLQPLPRRKYKRGDVFQFDFGMNSVPEMSYEHRGIIIGSSEKLLYVLPIYSFIKTNKSSLYDPDNNPRGNLFLLRPDTHPFIKHDSVVKLDDLRSISVSRIVYSHNYRMDIHSNEYKIIERAAFSFLFPEYDYQMKKLTNESKQ